MPAPLPALGLAGALPTAGLARGLPGAAVDGGAEMAAADGGGLPSVVLPPAKGSKGDGRAVLSCDRRSTLLLLKLLDREASMLGRRRPWCAATSAAASAAAWLTADCASLRLACCLLPPPKARVRTRPAGLHIRGGRESRRTARLLLVLQHPGAGSFNLWHHPLT